MPRNGLHDLGWALAAAADRFGDRPFLCSLESGEALTYADLYAGAARVANLCHVLGLRRGNRVAVRLPAPPEAACVLFGVMRFGAAAVVPAGSRPAMVSALAGRARAAFLATEEAIPGIPPACRHVVRMGGNGDPADERGMDGRALLAEAAPEPAAAVREASPGPGCLALICVGEDHEVSFSHEDVLMNALRLIERFRIRAEEPCVCLLPVDCWAGFVAMGVVALLNGGTAWWGSAAGPWVQPDVPSGWVIGRGEALTALAQSLYAPRPAFRLAIYPADSDRPGPAVQRLARRVEMIEGATPADIPPATLQTAPLQVV